ncbi:MAG TPA: alpha/beta fold hydrolase [Myxococcota bacterium]|nr:alpha/beta fold hydrolase [Myxococcota bacterium]
MPAVLAKFVYALAGVALAVSLVGLNRASNDIARSSLTLPGGVPAVVWEPSPPLEFGQTPAFDPPVPVVILCHGFSGDTAMTSALARRIAKAGYAVVAIDFRGHGENQNPFEVGGDGIQLRQDIDAALLYARSQPRFDGQRIALAGHSMGAFAVLSHAQHDPGVAAVIALSGAGAARGPYTPPNTLLIWAANDPPGLRKAARELAAKLAGLEQLVADKTYGDVDHGTGVRMSEVPGVDHILVLYSAETARRIVEWLGETLGPGAGPAETPGPDPRFPWIGLGLGALVVLAFGLPRALAPLAPRMGLAPVSRPLTHLVLLLLALAAAVAIQAGADAVTTRGAFGFVPLEAGRQLFEFFALAGVILLALGARRRAATADGLSDPRTWLTAGALFLAVYAVVGTLVLPLWNLFPATHRLVWALVVSGLMLPYFAASEWLLRGAGVTGLWLPAVGKLLTLLVVGAACVSGLLPFVIVLGLGSIALFFALFELIAIRISRCMPGPWIAALFQAAFTGFTFSAIFPFTGK